ncbi:peptide deformylase [Anaerobaca lacustris]|uniref:Peptide deformylase n=1 Tax=Anaerobaca lacustris TaxID=3044600 RepID=A0AAW6U6D7_9BACT|nr:peptide deformylase [Sedimentisphaerales bacterium M17dextr]
MAAGDCGETPRISSSRPIAPPPLSLRLYPDSVLRSVCHPVEHFDEWLTDVVEEMLALMRLHGGIGLAAPQVGIARRLFVAQVNRRSLCLINPVLVGRDGSDRMTEGCLSLPHVEVNVERNLQIEVQGFNTRGQGQRQKFSGLWARVVQHEMDHLDGILIYDYEKQPGNTP